MADFATVWNAETQTADWSLDGPDLATDDGLNTAVIISLMTDRLANADDVIPDGTTNRRGTWMDLPLDTTATADATPDYMGSRWWLLMRAKATEQTRQNFIAYTLEALAWGQQDGVWASVDVQAWWLALGEMAGLVTIIRNTPTGTTTHLFDLAWNATLGASVTPQGTTPYVAPPAFLAYPDPPTALTIMATTGTTVSLIWAPAVTGGAPSTYIVQVSPHGAADWTTAGTIAAPATGIVLSGLSTSTLYDFQVQTVNATGTSVDSAIVTGSTSANPPNAVTALAAGSVTANTMPLTWTAPAVDGTHGAATGYTVQYRINGSAIWITAATAVATAAYTVTGLIAGLTYQFNVIASNAAGFAAGVTMTHATGAAGGSFTYWGTGGYPTGSAAHGSTTTIVAFITNGGSIVSAQFGWSATQYDPPSSLQAMTEFNSGLFGDFSANVPAVAGSYHGWMIFYDGSGNALLAAISASGQTQQGGAAIMDPFVVT